MGKPQLPGGALTTTSFVLGWLFMWIGLVLTGLPWLDDSGNYVVQTTEEFLRLIPTWLFGPLCIVAGFFVAKPGAKHRTLKHTAAAGVPAVWVGVNVWPIFTGSGNPVSLIGIGIWVAIAMLLIDDAHSPAYRAHKYHH